MSGFTGRYARVEKISRTFVAIDITSGQDVTELMSTPTRTKAFRLKCLVGEYVTATGASQWRVSRNRPAVTETAIEEVSEEKESVPMSDEASTLALMMHGLNVEDRQEVVSFVHERAIRFKPATLIMDDLKWKYLMRSVVRGEVIMMTGPSGCGKTFAVQSVADAFPERKFFYVNLGSTQDPRATLIGNTHYDSSTGTYFAESYFVRAIQTPGAIILLDELSRAHPEAWNILMTVLDKKQRYLRLDEKDDSETISVAPGVCFIGTANIGAEYTATRVMDRALIDRFTTIEMDVLNAEQEYALLVMLYPEVDAEILKGVAEIAHWTREQATAETPEVSTMISTRASVQVASLLSDGFSLQEAAELAIFPFFDNDGGLNSERTKVKQVVQKYIKPEESADDLFDNLQKSLDEIPF